MKKRKICPLTDRCGGCQLQYMKYGEQLRYKQDMVEEVLHRYGPVAPIIGMTNPYHYRNKSQAVYTTAGKSIISGIYRKGTHYVIPVKSCDLEDEETDRIFLEIRKLARDLNIHTYDEDTGYGVLRHVLVKKGFSTGQIMVVLVFGQVHYPSLKEFTKRLTEAFPKIASIQVNINKEKTSMVLGEGRETLIYGKAYIEDSLCGLLFRISAKSFYQVNPVQAEKLYLTAMRMARLKETDVVLDAYCGTGTIALVAASQGIKKVTGIEINEDAVWDARINASQNEIKNASFVQGDASAYCKALAENKETVDVLFLDPPRAGSDERFLSAAIKLKPKTIIYISCNADTLDRDLRYLTRFGPYRVLGFQPFDMFPHTTHVEVAAVISREE